MLQDDTKESAAKEEEHLSEPEDTAKKTPRKRRRQPVKKQVLAGSWPKIAIVSIVLCLVFAGFYISTLTKSSTNTTDTAAPIIQNISISDVRESSSIITWKTNEPATSQVTACGADNCTTTNSGESLFINHTVTLTDIEPDTRYQITLSSKNKQGKEANITLDLNLNAKKTAVVGSQIEDIAPDFTLPTVDGTDMTLSQFRDKLVMINFWETTCPACEEETTYIQQIYNEWPADKLEVLTVSGERAQFVKSFLDTRGLTFPALIDGDAAVKNLYNVTTYPTTFFVNSEGIIKVIKAARFNSASEIATILKAL
jgi:peroxiredoxin